MISKIGAVMEIIVDSNMWQEKKKKKMKHRKQVTKKNKNQIV